MKKIICIFLILTLLPCIPAYAAGVGFAGVLDVPYDVTYELIVHDSFQIDTMHDLERLLYFVEKLHIEQVKLYPPSSLYDAALARVNEFLQEQDSEEVWFTYPPDEYNMTDEYFKFGLFWKDVHSLKMFQLPTISSTGELYREVLKCSNNKNWRKAYRLAEDYAAAIDVRNSDMDIAAAEILERYGVDVSEKIEYYAWEQAVYHQATGAYVLGIENRHINEVNVPKDEDRYSRILKNNVVIPITDNMTESEKIRILAQSTGNILNSYEITIPYSMKEWVYSRGVGLCAHYSDVFYDLCTLYGIECMQISGNLNGCAHGWNAVKCDGNWYYVDTTSTTVENREILIDHLSLALYNEEDLEDKGYSVSGEHPECTAESIIWNWEDFSLDPVFPDTVEKYEMFTPYRAYNPMTAGPMIYCNIYFEKSTGKIWAIDTNLSSDTWVKDESGNVSKKESTLEIPSEIDGVKVKIIGSNLDAYFNIPYYDNIIIPSDIALEHHAFYGIGNYNKTKVTLGDRVDIGIGALPNYKTLTLGDDCLFRGFDAASDYQNNEIFEYYDDFDAVVIYHTDDDTLAVPQGYSNALFGCGNNISDRTPVKNLVINKDVKYVDPRLNRLNRNFLVDADNPYYTSEDGVLYNKDKTVLISVPIGIPTFIIPDTVKEIGEYAFAYCNEISTLTIPESVEKVGYRAFWHLSNIKNICIEGNTPEGFAVTLSGNPNIFKASESDKVVLNHTYDGSLISIPAITEGESAVAFFDIYNKLLSIKKGNEVKIPPLAKSYKIFVWNKFTPGAIVEQGEF